MPTYLHDIEIYPHGGLPVQVILPIQYVLLVPCAVSSHSLNFVQIEYFSIPDCFQLASACTLQYMFSSVPYQTSISSVTLQLTSLFLLLLKYNHNVLKKIISFTPKNHDASIHVLSNILLRSAFCCMRLLNRLVLHT